MIYQTYLRRLAKIIVQEVKDKLDEQTANQLAELEQQGFGDGPTYYGPQPADDLIDDTEQPGAVFNIAKDEDKPVGYLGGYDFVNTDNAPDYDEFKDIQLYTTDNIKSLYKDVLKSARKGKVHYVANFNVLKSMADVKRGIVVTKLLINYLQQLKGKGYKYLAASMTPDSYNLLMRGGQPNLDRLQKFGVELVGVLPETHNVNMVLFRFSGNS